MDFVRAAAWMSVSVLAGTFACGGRVRHELRPSDSAAGAAGSGGGGSGGTGAVDAGGSAGQGGSAGTSGSAGMAGGSGTAGSAGVAANCLVPPEPTTACAAGALGGYYFDPVSESCTAYGDDCAGNENQFDSYVACAEACHPERVACDKQNDCELGSIGCCGWTCTGELDVRGFIAVNRKFASAQAREACPFPHYCGPGEPGPDDVLDLTCQYAIAICDAGRCRVADLRKLPVSECRRDADCRVRVSSQCCPSACAPPLVAVSSEAALERIVCADGAACTGDCSPSPQYRALCRDGVCTVAAAAP